MYFCCLLLLLSPLFVISTGQSTPNQNVELNKPFIKSIKGPDGDIIHCVLIAHQPAFDHPLLKNHTVQMKPSFHPEDSRENATRGKPKMHLWHMNGSCPKGTVPIRRTRKEDVLKASSLKAYRNSRVPQASGHAHEHAVAYVRGDKYYGAKAFLNLWDPVVELRNEFSLAQIWILGRSDANLNSVEAGWQIYPDVNDDSRPRLFIFYTTDNYETGCLNLLCPGFVQINNKIALGDAFGPVSSYAGKQYEIGLMMWKDPKSENWWLQVQGQLLGYWPSSLLPLLSDGANEIQWGGEVVNANFNGRHTTTQMGSGHFPEEGSGKASYVRNLQVIDEWNNLNPPQNIDTTVEQPSCYNIKLETGRSWGNYFYYGGPGRNPRCP